MSLPYSSAVKIFFLGWKLSEVKNRINVIQKYIQEPLPRASIDSMEWWMPLIEKLGVQKDFITLYNNEQTSTSAVFFLLKDSEHCNSLLSLLYSAKEFSNGTLPIEVYQQVHRTVEYIKNIEDGNSQLYDLFEITENIKRDINAVLGIITMGTEYMNITK